MAAALRKVQNLRLRRDQLDLTGISTYHISLSWTLLVLRYTLPQLESQQKPFDMLAPINFPVPEGTNAIYLTALSLSRQTSTASVSWTDDSATFGADFEGPSDTYVLGDRVFGSPIIAVTSVPSEISVSFDFEDTITQQHSVSEPITKRVGPSGNATSVQVSAYAASDHDHHQPTTITIVFQGSLHGLRSQS